MGCCLISKIQYTKKKLLVIFRKTTTATTNPYYMKKEKKLRKFIPDNQEENSILNYRVDHLRLCHTQKKSEKNNSLCKSH